MQGNGNFQQRHLRSRTKLGGKLPVRNPRTPHQLFFSAVLKKKNWDVRKKVRQAWYSKQTFFMDGLIRKRFWKKRKRVCSPTNPKKYWDVSRKNIYFFWPELNQVISKFQTMNYLPYPCKIPIQIWFWKTNFLFVIRLPKCLLHIFWQTKCLILARNSLLLISLINVKKNQGKSIPRGEIQTLYI